MSDTVLTPAGADWVAGKICDGVSNSDLFMYVIYSNNSQEYIDINSCLESEYFDNLPDGIGYMCVRDNVVLSTKPSSDAYSGNTLVFSTLVNEDNYVGGPSLESGTTMVISAAAGYRDKNGVDTIITIGNIGKNGVANPIPWVTGLDLSVSCPVVFNSTLG